MDRWTDRPCLFAAGAFRAYELHAGDIPALQRFVDANPEYYFAVNGQGPGDQEAHEQFHGGRLCRYLALVGRDRPEQQ